MKKLIYLFTALLGLASCKKSSFESVFADRPEVRMQKSIAEVNSILTTAPNGWIATLPSQAGGGYGFYIAFDAATQGVKMYGDMTDPTATAIGNSTFRVKANVGAELIFDTYNYISLLEDPDPTAFGGAKGSGLKSDVEFIFERATADSIVFTGKKYRQPFKLVKATAAQKTVFEAGGYKTAIDKIKNFFATVKNPYIDIAAGSANLKAGISVNVTNGLTVGKRVSFLGLLADGISTAAGTAKFAFKLEGADMLSSGLVYNGISFVRMGWKDAVTLAFYDNTGKEYIIKSNPTPLTPLSLLFGFPTTTFPYKTITIPNTGLPNGVTSAFNAVYTQMSTLFATSGRSVTSTSFSLTSNSVFLVEIKYLSGTSAFIASATYNYTRNGDVITLDNNPVPNGNWNTRITQIKPLADYMLTGPFRIDWVISTDPSVVALGGLYRTNSATSFIYGNL